MATDPDHPTNLDPDWLPISTAPRDGSLVEMRQGPWAPFHAWWREGRWVPVEFKHGLPATHWRKKNSNVQS